MSGSSSGRAVPGHRTRIPRGRVILLIGTALAAALGWSLLGPAGAWGQFGSGSFGGPLPTCTQGDSLTAHRDPEDWARTFLDTEYALAPDDVPPDLVPVTDAGVPGRGRVRALVIEDLDALYRAAVKAGETFRVVSAYRSYDQQVATFASLEQAYGQDYAVASAARPGHSEHQLGTTIDVEGGDQWLARNAWRYGFVMSYLPDRSPEWTCYKPEPWHFRYFGRSVAKAIHESAVSAREWLWELQDEGPRP